MYAVTVQRRISHGSVNTAPGAMPWSEPVVCAWMVRILRDFTLNAARRYARTGASSMPALLMISAGPFVTVLSMSLWRVKH